MNIQNLIFQNIIDGYEPRDIQTLLDQKPKDENEYDYYGEFDD